MHSFQHVHTCLQLTCFKLVILFISRAFVCYDPLYSTNLLPRSVQNLFYLSLIVYLMICAFFSISLRHKMFSLRFVFQKDFTRSMDLHENLSAGQNWPTDRINCASCGIVIALCNRCSCRVNNYNCPGCTNVLESSYRTFIQPPKIEYFCTCNLDELHNKTNDKNSSKYLGQLVNMFSKCVSFFFFFFPIVLMTLK